MECNLTPVKFSGINNPEIRELEDLIERNRTSLEEKLDKNQIEILKTYTDCINEYILVFTEQAFCDGFSVGTKIIVEALTDAEKIL